MSSEKREEPAPQKDRPPPPESDRELADDELEQASGGMTIIPPNNGTQVNHNLRAR